MNNLNNNKDIKTICSACGTSPVNHHFLFISNFLDESLGKLTDKIFKFNNTQTWNKISIYIEKSLFNFLYFMGIVRYSNNIKKSITGRSKLIWEEAQKRQIPMEQIKIFGKYIEFYRAKIDGKYNYFHSLPIPPTLNQNGYKWLDNKFILFEKLSANNISVPKTKEISSWKEAKINFSQLEKPIIIKPKNGSRGRHTITNIKTENELKNAFNLAKQITLWMVMQEHLHGSVYRATVINNKLVGFFRADSPNITGDGIKNIKELIQEKNKYHHQRLSEIQINDDLINFIQRQNYTLESVLPKNITINLSAKTGRMYGGYTKEMLPEIHPKMHEIFKKAGEIVEAPVVGFDLIIQDPTKDPDIQKWGIIECNSLPFIDLHYFALEGTPINLAKNVWDLWK